MNLHNVSAYQPNWMKTVQESHLLEHRNSELLKPWAFKGPTIFNVLPHVIILSNNNTNNNDSGLHTTIARNPKRDRERERASWWWSEVLEDTYIEFQST
jgi:hypothetical protein